MWIFFLDTTPKLHKCLLHSYSSMKAETRSINPLYFVASKSICLPCTLNVPFTHKWFYYTMIGDLENVGSLNYTYLPDADTLLHTIQKLYGLLSPLFKSETCLIVERLSSITMAETIFPKFWFWLESSNFISDHKYCYFP